MLRTLFAGASAGLLLAAGSLVPATSVDYAPWGSTSAIDQLLKPGCRHYHYRFRIDPPTDNWAAELFLIGPRGGHISSSAYLAPSDPRVGRAAFRLCRQSIIAGKHTIRMKISYKDGYDKYEGWVKPSHFRLLRRR